MLRFDALTEADRDLVGKCLEAAVEGPFFPNEEFPTLFGLERSEVDLVRRLWPNINPLTEAAVMNSLNNLLGYPHDCSLEETIGHSSEELKAALSRLAPWPWPAD